MLQKTRGIVINYIKFKESSIISKIYTEKLGLQSYIVNGVRSKSSKKSISLFQPLTLLEMVAYHKKSSGNSVSRLSEYKCVYPFRSIPYEIKKTTLAIFIAEILSKTLKEEAEDTSGQFDFLFNAIENFDRVQSGYESFHLQLMAKLAHYLGFGIYDLSSLELHEQVKAGAWTKECCEYIIQLQSEPLLGEIQCANSLRKEALVFLINYYRDHIESFGDVKSLAVLRQLFT